MLQLPIFVASFLIGLCLGSFANVVALRDERRKSIITGRSECPYCKHTLQWYELIPLFSFFIQGGKCRQCGRALSWRYPLVEVGMAGLTVYAVGYGYLVKGSWLLAGGLTLSFLFFLVLSLIDLQKMEVPLDYVVVAGGIGGIGRILSTLPEAGSGIRSTLIGLVAGAGVVALVVYGWRFFFHQDGMGVGDIWLAGAIGAVVGYPQVFVALMVAVFVGAFLGLVLMGIGTARQKGQTAGSGKWHQAVPFGPFLFLGLLVSLGWGPTILNWYLNWYILPL